MRASRYNIYVPLLQDDTCLAIQGYTGAIDRISPAVHRFLQAPEADGPAVSPATVERLVRRGYLTTRSPEEERERMAVLARAVHRIHLQNAAFLIAPTLGCQLRCPYCYEAPTAHRDGPAPTMTAEHVRLAFAAMEAIVRDRGKRPPKEITLYGGEPLLAANRDIVRLIVEDASRRRLRTKAVTNGVDLTHYEDLLGAGGISHLQITIDGPAAVHDRRRIGKGRVPTFSRIGRGVDLALARGCAVSVRTNVDTDNVGSLVELNAFYHERGWAGRPGFTAYANVTHDWVRAKTLLPLPFLEAVEDAFRGSALPRVITVNLGVDQILTGLLRPGALPALRPYFCGANVGSYIFAPDGDVYACWDEIGREEGRIARYVPELAWVGTAAEEWVARHVGNIPECVECPYALLCGGGCGVQAKTKAGSLLRPFCYQFQETFRFLVPRLFKANEAQLSTRGVTCG